HARAAPVQFGACGIGKSVVRRIPDQQMTEAKAVLARKHRPIGANQLLADEGGEPGCHLALLRRKRLDCAAVEELALDRPALERLSLGWRELVKSRRKKRAKRRRNRDLAVALFGHREHLPDEERVPSGRLGDAFPEFLRNLVADEVIDVGLLQRVQPKRDRPRRAAVDELGPRRADEQDRGARRQQRDMLQQVEERLLAPLDVVEDRDERRLLFEQLAEGPGDLSRGRAGFRLAEERPDRVGGRLVAWQGVELLDRIDDRPIGDPFAVRQATRTNDTRLRGRDRLRDESRLPDSWFADNREQLAPLAGERALPRFAEERELSFAADKAAAGRAVARLVRRDEAEGLNRLRLPLQLQRLECIDLDGIAHELERRGRAEG